MRLFKTVLKPYALYYRRLKMPNIGNKSLRSMAHKSRNARQVGNDCHIVSHFLGLLTTQISLWDRTPPKGSRRRFQSWPAALLKRCWCYSMLLMHTSARSLQDYSMISYHGRLVSYTYDAVSRPVCKFSPHYVESDALFKTFAHNGISCRECLKVVRVVACNFCVILGYPILEPEENPTLLPWQKSNFWFGSFSSIFKRAKQATFQTLFSNTVCIIISLKLMNHFEKNAGGLKCRFTQRNNSIMNSWNFQSRKKIWKRLNFVSVLFFVGL